MEKVNAGEGRIAVHGCGNEAILSELSYSYPLKLLSPRTSEHRVALVYVLSYGGGLVGGDRIKLSAIVQDGAILVVLSQGSTKVFKTRPGQGRLARSQAASSDDITSQRLDVEILPQSALLLLPDPVTCFRSAKYDQIQIFRLASDSSAVLLDWITSGRKSIGEDWDFKRYYSLNEVWIDGQRVARDALLLEEQENFVKTLQPRTLGDKLAPYSCYATVLMYGSLAEATIRQLASQFADITVFKSSTRPPLLWSFSALCEGKGCILRVAGKETEDVRFWLRDALRDLESVVAPDIYRKAFG